MEDQKLALEAELGRLFLELERAREFQGQVMQRMNQIKEELKKLDESAPIS